MLKHARTASAPVLITLLTLAFFVACKKEDKTAPVISLSGGGRIVLDLGQAWSEPGYSASDDEDGEVSGAVVVTGSVNTQAVGHYTLTYTVGDAAGNQASVTRDVFVSARLLAGDYHVDAQVTGANAGTYTYTLSVTADTAYDVLFVQNMCDFGNQVVVKIRAGQDGILLSPQALQGVPQLYEGTISGEGSYDGENIAITALNYLISYLNGAADQGTMTLSRR